MSEKINTNLATEIAKSLSEAAEIGINEELDIQKNPIVSIAVSLLNIEHTLQGMLYIQNCAASGLEYNKDYFYAICEGIDPEEFLKEQEAERQRLIALASQPEKDND